MGLSINKGKPGVMGVSKRSERLPVTVNKHSTALKQVDSFTYLRSLVSEEGRRDMEIRARIGMAKANF